MKDADDIRVELIVEGALELYEEVGADVSEVYSQPRIAQETVLRTYGGTLLKPGWSPDLALNDPFTGQRWDVGTREARARVRRFVRDSKPFMLIGSPLCTMFSVQRFAEPQQCESQ